jgi:amidase
VLIKDNIETREMPTTAGSLALLGNNTGRDAPLVARLRDAGMIILGKTNLSEWANFRSSRSSSGWSAVGGQTRNPYALNRSPCGSSSGSAAAVAAELVTVAVGTETSGSIICPASVTGLVGIKPTVGLVSRTHIVPISHTQDTAGPMARSVADAAALLTAMQGPDPQDPATQNVALSSARSYLDKLRGTDGLRGKRIGVLRSAAGFHEGVDGLLDVAVEVLRDHGVEIVDGLQAERTPEARSAAYRLLLYQFQHNLDRYLATLPGDYAALTLDRLIQFNEAHADQEMRWFRQERFEQARDMASLSEEAYQQALTTAQGSARRHIDTLLESHRLDALIGPSNGPAWVIDRITGDRFLGGSSALPAIAGYPHLTVTMGEVQGLPVGLSIFGAAFSEPILIEIGHGFEQATRLHQPPALIRP